jgi:hypothetical protein
MLISESYKKRLQELAGIKNVPQDADDEERSSAFAMSNQRVPFSKDLMIQAINEGREVGILFQSNNEKYKMPTSKYRTIYPVAIGTSKAGNQVLRAVHKFGQSESAALKTGKRSQEVKDEWRMFKVSNIKSMWFTGKFFDIPPKHYNAADKGMVNVEVAADFEKIKEYQAQLAIDMKKQEKPKPNIVSLFKEPEAPVEPETQTDAVTEPKPEKLKGTIAPKKTIPTNNKKEDRQ